MIAHITPKLLASAGVAPQTPWTPASLGDLRGWWVPESLALTPGTAVGALNSSGGVTNALTAAGASRPAYQLSGGRGALAFDGVDDAMNMSDLSISNAASALTFFMLFRLDSIGADANFMNAMAFTAATASGTRYSIGLRNTAGTSKVWGANFRNLDASGTTSVWSAVNGDTNTHVLIASISRTVGNAHVELWLDETLILNSDSALANGAWDATDSAVGIVGNRSASVNNSIAGKMINFGVLRSAPTTDDRRKLAGYLAYYGGIQSQLPSDHPYRNAIPTL